MGMGLVDQKWCQEADEKFYASFTSIITNAPWMNSMIP